MRPHPQTGCVLPQGFWAGECPISRELFFCLPELSWATLDTVVASGWEADRQETKQIFLLCLLFSFPFSLFYGDMKARRKQTDFLSSLPQPLQRPLQSWHFSCLGSGIRQLNRADVVEELLSSGSGSGCRLTLSAPAHTGRCFHLPSSPVTSWPLHLLTPSRLFMLFPSPSVNPTLSWDSDHSEVEIPDTQSRRH